MAKKEDGKLQKTHADMRVILFFLEILQFLKNEIRMGKQRSMTMIYEDTVYVSWSLVRFDRRDNFDSKQVDRSRKL